METISQIANDFIGNARKWFFNDDHKNFSKESDISKETLNRSLRKEMQESLHEIARDCELQVLSHSGLNLQTEVEIKDISIGACSHGENQWIHTTHCIKQKSSNQLKNNTALPPMVLLHGFAASSVTYYKMLAPLSEKYDVYALDLPGMGLSSKPEWKFQGPEEAIEYFVESLEEWRKQLGIEKFTLVGHSLGGYITGQYALHYPQRLDKIILLSAAGVTTSQQETQNNSLEDSGSPFHQKILAGVVDYFWQNQITFNKIYRETKFLPAETIMRQYMKTLKLPHSECEAWSQYYDKLLLLPESSEKSIYNLLQSPGGSAFLPLESLFPGKLQVPVHFCYGGENDWMCSTGAKKLIMENKVQGSFRQIEHFNHQFTFFNPEEASDYILSL